MNCPRCNEAIDDDRIDHNYLGLNYCRCGMYRGYEKYRIHFHNGKVVNCISMKKCINLNCKEPRIKHELFIRPEFLEILNGHKEDGPFTDGTYWLNGKQIETKEEYERLLSLKAFW